MFVMGTNSNNFFFFCVEEEKKLGSDVENFYVAKNSGNVHNGRTEKEDSQLESFATFF